MGFGYLFIGFLLLSNFVYASLTLLPATLISYLALDKLAKFNRPLREARTLLLPVMLTALALFVLELGRMFGLFPATISTWIDGYLPPVRDALLAVFFLRLFAGIAELCDEVDLQKQRFAAKRDGFLSAFLYLLSAAVSLPIGAEWYTSFAVAATLPVLLFRLIVMILDLILIYACYMWICMPEDADMARKPTGIAPLDAMEDALNEKMDKANEAKREELEKIYREREARYHEKHDKEGKK